MKTISNIMFLFTCSLFVSSCATNALFVCNSKNAKTCYEEKSWDIKADNLHAQECIALMQNYDKNDTNRTYQCRDRFNNNPNRIKP
ncbi:MAG: hypothetical protein HQK54_15555 [Oligoflexales bacterium]|nr:hypothetical protein [Oligoflexales bacterium]